MTEVSLNEWKSVGKSVGKGEIAPHKQFLLLKHCFLKI